MGIAACQLFSWEKSIFFYREKSLKVLLLKKRLHFLMRTLSYIIFHKNMR